jgi:hypothetical protein
MNYEDAVCTGFIWFKIGMVTTKDPWILKEKEMCLNTDALLGEKILYNGKRIFNE